MIYLNGGLKSITIYFAADGYALTCGNILKTCHDDFRLEHGFNLNTQECADMCSDNLECAYFYLNANGWCGLYSSCEWLRQPGLYGSTYHEKSAWALKNPFDKCKIDAICVNQCEFFSMLLVCHKLMQSYWICSTIWLHI